MFEQPPTFDELMTWAETGVPPELQEGTPPNRSVVVETLENETLSNETGDTKVSGVTTTTPRERMSRTWLQGLVAAGAVAALEVVVALNWTDELDYRFIAFALVQAFVTGVVAYVHRNKKDGS